MAIDMTLSLQISILDSYSLVRRNVTYLQAQILTDCLYSSIMNIVTNDS